ncbi:MAG: carboxynorspermidine decarboxylase [Prevotellaceae bacterium]|jgi:carboxynorspermidine decarboxylase|nr:carboxynorspermidine decarboxylase [Prevotellaceae bacterium]
MIDYTQILSPCFVIDEERLRQNLRLISSVKERAGVEIIMAFKAFAAWRVFPVIKEYINLTTASSLAEARLAVEEMGSLAHTYAPVYTEREFPEIAACSSHITFNSLAQFEKFHSPLSSLRSPFSIGLRVNPEISVVETDLYNPAKAGSRLGIVADLLPETLPEDVEGLHFHALCESSSYDLEKVLSAVEEKFGKYFSQIKWLNMGGGHLMTRKDYDVEHLVSLLKNFKRKHPHLQIILEPGAAFVWQAGELVSTVQDVVENGGIKTAILDVSFACHTPDCLEMPYQPEILGANICGDAMYCVSTDCQNTYRMGGNSCLSGDFLGDWHFEKPLSAGDRIIFQDMIHYTTVKTTMFNGVSHPAIGLWTCDGKFVLLREFSSKDYKNRMC